MTKYAIYTKWFWNEGIASAEEILDLKEELESRVVERAKGSGLRPTSVEEAKKKLEEKKENHKKLWDSIRGNYEPFLMEFLPSGSYTSQGIYHESEPEPEPEFVARYKRSSKTSSSGLRPRMKKKQTKKRKKKKQTRKYKKLR